MTSSLYAQRVENVEVSEREPVEVSPCPVCRSMRAVPRFRIVGMTERVVVCSECGLGRLHPMPDAEVIESYYPDEYYGEPGIKFQPLVERLVRWVGSRHISFLSQGLEPGARVLDVGCGRGVILGALADRGFEVHGFEISAEAARGADARAQVTVAGTLTEAEYPSQYFDQVVIWHVFEHIVNPVETLESVHRILKPGGRLIVAVPNFSSLQSRWSGPAWFHLDLPRHLYQFPLSALRALLDRSGFEVGNAHHFSLRQNPFGWIQSALNAYSSLPRNALYVMLHRRTSAGSFPFGLKTRLWLSACLIAGTPIALLMTVLETLARNGATVHAVCRRR
ncbi:class I SAM-dependent methyltransferase [Myxococcota bacterium]|nr:class I SAM-dependent methyltransferase [Myxococcota bacterium]